MSKKIQKCPGHSKMVGAYAIVKCALVFTAEVDHMANVSELRKQLQWHSNRPVARKLWGHPGSFEDYSSYNYITCPKPQKHSSLSYTITNSHTL